MNNVGQVLPVAPAAAARWAVRFLPLQRTGWGKTPTSRWRWTGKGAVSVSAAGIELGGYRRRILWIPAKQRVELTPSQVRNVAVTGRVVRFEADGERGKSETVRLRAADAEAATRLAEALPRTCTPAFARTQAEQQAFTRALEQLGTRPIVTWVLIALNVAVYLAAASQGAGWLVAKPAVLIHWGTNFGPLTLAGQWWRLFTSMFVHFGLVHIALNMWVLAALGPRVERLFGSTCYLILYVFAGLCGSLASLWWHPAVNSAGASGAIFGVIGGLLAFAINPATRLPASITANERTSAVVFILYNLMYGFGHQGIDNACHVGGLVGGLMMGWLLAQPLDPEARRAQSHRLYLGTALGLASLLALAWPLARRAHFTQADAVFEEDLLSIGPEETQAVSQMQKLAQKLQSHQITQFTWADETSKTVIPLWVTMEGQIKAHLLPASSPNAALRTALLTYLDERRQGLQWLAKGEHFNDNSEMQRGAALMRQSDAAARQVRALIEQRR
jgi:membrane associated rhomboid family serine protease